MTGYWWRLDPELSGYVMSCRLGALRRPAHGLLECAACGRYVEHTIRGMCRPCYDRMRKYGGLDTRPYRGRRTQEEQR